MLCCSCAVEVEKEDLFAEIEASAAAFRVCEQEKAALEGEVARLRKGLEVLKVSVFSLMCATKRPVNETWIGWCGAWNVNSKGCSEGSNAVILASIRKTSRQPQDWRARWWD